MVLVPQNGPSNHVLVAGTLQPPKPGVPGMTGIDSSNEAAMAAVAAASATMSPLNGDEGGLLADSARRGHDGMIQVSGPLPTIGEQQHQARQQHAMAFQNQQPVYATQAYVA